MNEALITAGNALNPATGNDSNLILIIAIAAAALVGVVLSSVFLFRKK